MVSFFKFRYKNSLSTIPWIGIKKSIVQGLCQLFSNIASGIVFTAALWYGQHLIKTECHTYSAGILVVVSQTNGILEIIHTFVQIFIACLNTTWCLSQLVPSLEKFADAIASSSFILNTISTVDCILNHVLYLIKIFFDQKSRIDASNREEGVQPSLLKGEIQLQNVSFTYPARQDQPVCCIISHIKQMFLVIYIYITIDSSKC